MVENKKLKRDLILQSFAPLFLLLMVKHSHCYWSQIIPFFKGIAVGDWSVLQKAINHPFFGDCIVFAFSAIWIIWAGLIYLGFIGILRVKYEARGENVVVSTDKRDVGATFLISFVLPLLLDDVSTIRGCVIFAIMLIMVIALLVKSNLFYQNPVLTILGYKAFEFQFVNPYMDIKHKNKTYIGITKGPMIVEEAAIKRKFIADDVFIIFNS